LPLRLYDTLRRDISEFQPLQPGEVKMYVCGITPYDVTHLGHAFSYIQFDALRRYLEWSGYRVHYVQNLTDIDDDMIMVSKRQGGRPIPEIRDENDAIFRADLDRLNVLRPSAYPCATDHIPRIIEMTSAIIRNGCGYAVDGDVFFEAAAFPPYGRLNGVSIAELAKRENPESKREHKKRGPLDFLLWQRAEPGEPSWESPWGRGRPGWSIECSAMSTQHLGDQLDIHGGGRDLMFPHHENEIAQSECATGRSPFVRWWMHNGMLKLDGVKMSKSLGNLILARDLMKQFPPDHLRLYLLGIHYRTDADYRASTLPALGPRYERLQKAISATLPEGANGVAAETLEQEFRSALDEDFDLPAALDVLDAAAGRVMSGGAGASEQAKLRELMAVLGFAMAGAPGPATGHYAPTSRLD
jgi:cysteinyl-tRNA synthetase